MGIISKNIYKELPPEVDKTYVTKLSTQEKFTVKEITYNKKGEPIIRGIYESAPHLGLCPFEVNRLILDKVLIGTEEVCSICNTII